MANIQEVFIKAFQHHQMNEHWVAAMLYALRIYKISRRNFDRIFDGNKSSSNRLEASLTTETKERSHLDWKPVRFPPLANIFSHYQTLSTVYMIYVLVRNVILLQHSSRFVKMDRPAHCFLPGYFFLHPDLARQFATSLASLHLLWRLTQFLAQRPYFLHMFSFLTLNNQNLKLFWSQFESQQAPLGTLQYQPPARTSISRLGPGKNLGDALIQHPVERFLQRVTCYRVEFKDRTCYRLRPNRSREARERLQRMVAKFSLYVGSFFCTLVLCITLTILTLFVNDRGFVERYPGCDANLDQLKRLNHLEHWSLSWTWAELYTLPFDVLENLILWGDSGVAVLFVWTAVYLLNFDNQVHLIHLDRKLKHVEARVQRAHLDDWDGSLVDLESRWVDRTRNSTFMTARTQTFDNMKTLGVSASYFEPSASLQKFCINTKPKCQVELDDAVHDLQMHFEDFFRELKLTDELISEVITSTICIWLSLFSIMVRHAFNAYALHKDPLVLQLVFIIGVFGFLIFTIVSSSLLNLHRNCLKSHLTLCSLMGYYGSEQKVKFLKLMEFYTAKKRSAYTILHDYPYTKTTYLSIFGWTLSCLFILDGLTRS